MQSNQKESSQPAESRSDQLPREVAVDSKRNRLKTAFNSSVGPAMISMGTNSFVNLVVVVIAARKLSPDEMGVFLLAYSTIVFITGLNQAVNVEPLILVASRNSSTLNAVNRRLVLRSSLRLGVIASLTLAVASTALPSRWTAIVIVLCLSIPLLLVLDANRVLLQSGSKGWSALRIDCLMYTLLFCMLTAFYIKGSTAFQALLAYITPIALLAGCVIVGVESLAKNRTARSRAQVPVKYRRDLTAEFSLMQGANQAILYSTPLYLSLGETAGFRGVQVLFGPMNVLYTAIRIAVVPRISLEIHRPGDGKILKIWISHGWPILVSGLVFSGIVIAGGELVGPIILGETFTYAKTLVLPLSLQYLALSLISFSTLMLRATARTSLSLIARCFQAAFVLVGGGVAWYMGGLQVLGWTLAVSTALSAAIWLTLSSLAARQFLPGGK